MKEILWKLLTRLENQELMMLTLTERLDALQATFDRYHPEATDDRLQLCEELRHAADSTRRGYEVHYDEIRKLIANIPD